MRRGRGALIVKSRYVVGGSASSSSISSANTRASYTHTIRVRSSAACLNRGPLVAHVTRPSLSLGVCCASLPDWAVGVRDSRGLWPESGASHRIAKSSFNYLYLGTARDLVDIHRGGLERHSTSNFRRYCVAPGYEAVERLQQ